MYLIPNLGTLENSDPRRDGVSEAGGWDGREQKVPWEPSCHNLNCISPSLLLRVLERLAKMHLDEIRLQHEIQAAVIILILVWVGNSKGLVLGIALKKSSIHNNGLFIPCSLFNK